MPHLKALKRVRGIIFRSSLLWVFCFGTFEKHPETLCRNDGSYVSKRLLNAYAEIIRSGTLLNVCAKM